MTEVLNLILGALLVLNLVMVSSSRLLHCIKLVAAQGILLGLLPLACPHRPDGGAWEYSVVMVVRDENGKEINRQVVGVGAMFAGDERSFSLSVEVTPTSDQRRGPRRGGTRH